MHIEPGVVDAAKIGLSYATATGTMAVFAKLALDNIKENNIISFAMKTFISMILTFTFFEIFPHLSVGVSEVHLILGSTLFLVFGLAPAGAGLALGLLIQSLFFSPMDLAQYGMNVTTLLAPLLALSYLAKTVVSKDTSYTELKYSQVLKLSLVYQAGIVTWVAFWAFYGQGFAIENLVSVSTFAIAYMSVIVIEPIISLATLTFAKSYKQSILSSRLIERKVYS